MQLLGFYIVCDGCGCNYYVFTLYAMDVGAITRLFHCFYIVCDVMWVQLLGLCDTLYAMDVGAITRFLRWIVCDGCGCNY